MGKPASTPVGPGKPDQPGPIDPTDGPKKVKDAWAKSRVTTGKGKQPVAVPGSKASVDISKITTSGNVVSVWTSDDTTTPPDYVIVNPPTAVYLDSQTTVEDPLGAIAYIINGAAK